MEDYNLDEEEDNYGIISQISEVFFETNNDLQNDVLIVEQRGEKIFEPREEIRAKMSTPTPSRNLTKNHPLEKIIGSKEKDGMTMC